MKHQITFLFVALALTLSALSPQVASASTKEFTFVYQFAGERLEIRERAHSEHEAFRRAATRCFDHFTGTRGNQKVSEERGLPVIDVCANPRS